jgi:acyl-CoA thioesterase
MPREAQELAAACAKKMLAEDGASNGLGMELVSVEPGRAVMTMKVRDDMVNGHGICHGGFIFTFADSTFAFACNTYNQLTVAASAEISFLSPVMAGEHLTARGEEIYRKGRNGIYDILVTRENGETVAAFRGKSRSLNNSII